MTTATLIKESATHLLRPRRPSLREGMLRGAVAGAAGTTALNAVTYLDMVVRGRGASSTPEQSVEKLSDTARVPIPGDGEKHQNRVSGLGPMLGIAAGVSTGAALGAVRATGARPPLAVESAAAGLGAMVAGSGPLAALGISDPRAWSVTDWVADVVPHAAYALVTAWTLDRLS